MVIESAPYRSFAMLVGWPRYDLFVITDPVLSRGRSHTEMARAALEGGADAVQLRDKSTPAYNLCRSAMEIQPVARKFGAVFIINDRVDVALVAGVDGVHVGQSALPVREARKLLTRPLVLGVSAADKALARKAERAGADYLGVGPVFPTSTKPDGRPPLGVEGLAAIVRSVSIPVVAIGGINHDNVARVIEAGAAGAAVVSAVATADDMAAAARALKRRIVEARRGGAAGA
jgi:thiamine-phosphate pyrophosphorylase